MLKCENLPRTNSTKYETQNILVKFQQNEHTPGDFVTVLVDDVCNCDNICMYNPKPYVFWPGANQLYWTQNILIY